jgi:hypothetical protein
MGVARKATKYAVDINGEIFKSGEALRDRCRLLLDKYVWPGCPLDVSLSDDDASFFLSLVRIRDPGRIPPGDYVADVCRTTRDGQVGRHLAFFYGSGTKDMIGWSKLCAGKRKKPQQVTDAMRQAVASQMMRAYSSAFSKGGFSVDESGSISIQTNTAVCPKSGRTLSPTGEYADDCAVVHHDGVSFSELRDIWLDSTGYTVDCLPIVELEIGGCSLAPGDALESWQAFHASNANLVVVSKKWHDEHHSEERRLKKEMQNVIGTTTQNS